MRNRLWNLIAVICAFCLGLVMVVLLGMSPDSVMDSKDPEVTAPELSGCYQEEELIYSNPLSSTAPMISSAIYGITGSSLVIAADDGGFSRSYRMSFEETPIDIDEFRKDQLTIGGQFPDMSEFTQIFRVGHTEVDGFPQFGLYQVDDALWFVHYFGKRGTQMGYWRVVSLTKMQDFTLEDLDGLIADQEKALGKQMTMRDVYAIARKGESITLEDFDPFAYIDIGSGVRLWQYDTYEGPSVLLRIVGGQVHMASLRAGCWSIGDQGSTIDLREGFEAVASYMNPVNTRCIEFHLDYDLAWTYERTFLYESVEDQARYYLDSRKAESFYVVFPDNERLELIQALDQSRISIDDVLVSDIGSIDMVPIDNPLGGHFAGLDPRYRFWLNGELFYPSKSFMYVTMDSALESYFKISELYEFLWNYGYDQAAEVVLTQIPQSGVHEIAGRKYVSEYTLKRMGISVDVGWQYSSHTPVSFIIPT